MKQEKTKISGQWDDKILTLSKLGFSQAKIAVVLELDEKYIKRRKEVLIAQGRLTRDGILSARENIEELADKRRKAISEMHDEVDISVANSHMEYAKAKFKLGAVSTEDIEMLVSVMYQAPELMGTNNINFIITYYTRSGNINGALNFIERCLIINEDKKIKLEAAREEILRYGNNVEQDKDRKAEAKPETKAQANGMSNKEIRDVINVIGRAENVIARRRSLMNIIMLDREQVSMVVFKNQMRYVMAEIALGELDMEDFNLLKEVIQTRPELIDDANVKFIIDYLVSQEKTYEATRFVSECVSLMEESGEKSDVIDEVRNELRQYKRKEKSKEEFRKRLDERIEERLTKAIAFNRAKSSNSSGIEL